MEGFRCQLAWVLVVASSVFVFQCMSPTSPVTHTASQEKYERIGALKMTLAMDDVCRDAPVFLRQLLTCEAAAVVVVVVVVVMVVVVVVVMERFH